MVAVLSHNVQIVLAMGLTILGILVTLLGLFKLFGWTLGIIEAVSLSILVGNSLDYCIHLSEGYLATDSRHLAFLSRYKVGGERWKDGERGRRRERGGERGEEGGERGGGGEGGEGGERGGREGGRGRKGVREGGR